MKKKLISLVFAAVFVLGCLVPTAGLLLTGGAKAGANEVLPAKPVMVNRDGSFNGNVLADAAKYVDKRFSFRQEAVTAWASLNAELFRTSVTDSVILGRDGWLYYAPTLPDYTSTAPMTERELWCAARTLYLLQEYAESRGGRFLFTVAPNKNSLYPEAMPSYPRADGESNARRLFALLEGMGVDCLDLFSTFDAESETLYFPGDSHWNAKGAALAADAILEALGRESDYYNADFNDGEHLSDLYEMLYPAGTQMDADYVYRPGFTFTANSANPDSITITTESGGEGGLLLFRDSFGRNLYPYLAEEYAHAVFSRRNDYSPAAMADGDAVVVELVERNLRYLNEYLPTVPAPERVDVSTDGAVVLSSALSQITLAKSSQAGYTVLRGDYGGLAPDGDSPVYVAFDGRVYEAVPGPDGWSACLPEEAAGAALTVLFTAGGNRIALSGVIE